MRLRKARVQSYRSIRDTGLFEIETTKTILVGPNEAGKTALLQALQQINPPDGTPGFDALRDYPRSSYNDITTGKVDPSKVTVVEAHFVLEDSDKAKVPDGYKECLYVQGTNLDNKRWYRLDGGPTVPKYGTLKKDLIRLASHMDSRVAAPAEGAAPQPKPSEKLAALVAGWDDNALVDGAKGTALKGWLEKNLPSVDEANEAEGTRYDSLMAAVGIVSERDRVRDVLSDRVPVFVLFNNYFRVRPLIHLDHLAKRLEQNILDDDQYDYGNLCLLKLLGFTARELSDMGKATEPPAGKPDLFKAYRDQLDRRTYQLNSASVQLTNEIRSVWLPDVERGEADRVLVRADGQYLKAVVEDDLGVEVELNQRSEGFQWLVSFFIVFFAEARGKHENAVLLLDEPGQSLHGLKQRDFRGTISRLAEGNQTIYTTHSPFLVGPDELDIVRVIEMKDRKVGTKVHDKIIADDPAALLPLQEALGYDLAQSLFTQQRNLVLEGLTDYWYIEGTAELLREAGLADLNEKIALVPAASAGKVVYYATILYAQKLKVAALLDSDSAGDQAANQEVLLHTLGNKGILRTKDAYVGDVTKPEVEDLLRETLVKVAKDDLGWNVEAQAASQPKRPIVDIFETNIVGFSKYRLAKAYLRWTRTNTAANLTANEQAQWASLIANVNKALK